MGADALDATTRVENTKNTPTLGAEGRRFESCHLDLKL